MDNDSQKKIKNKFNNYIIFTSIKLLNFFGFKYNIPNSQLVPKNHLDKYIEYQLYLQKEKEKKQFNNYRYELNSYHLKKFDKFDKFNKFDKNIKI